MVRNFQILRDQIWTRVICTHKDFVPANILAIKATNNELIDS